jgi:uncharacterized protein (TIGR03790 family)
VSETACKPLLVVVRIVVCALLLAAASRADAARRDVLLVVNARVPDGARIAEAYGAARDIPASHVLALDVPPGESIARSEFLARIQAPVAEWIHRQGAHDEIVHIVLFRGVPLKVAPDAASRVPLVSVDSSLSLLYRVLVGGPVGPGPIQNPYFSTAPAAQGWPAFDRQTHDIYLVSRLDGFTADDAAQLAGRCTALPPGGRTVILDGVPPGAPPEHGWFPQAAERLRALADRGVTVELDQTPERVRARTAVIGFYGWGASDPSQRARTLPLTLLPGAIGASLSASDARTLTEPPAAWLPGAWRQADRVFEGTADTLAGDMVRAGFTGWSGAVADPLVDGLVRPHILFPAYVSGRSLAEAYALATRHVGWRMVVFGDPLCRPFGPEPAPVTYTRDERSGLTRPYLDRTLAMAARGAPRATPESIEVQVAARARIQRGDRDAGLALLRERVAAVPDDVAALQLLAVLLDSVKERDEALRTYRALLAVRPNDLVASNNLAYALAEDPAQHAEALALARRAHEQARGEPTVADTYGWVLYQTGDVLQAVRVLQEAVRRGPALAEARLHLALAHLKGGQTAEAEAAWKETIRLDPSLAARPAAAPLRQAFPASTP